MTRPIFEDGYSKEIGRGAHRTSQLERRPNDGSGAAYQVKVFDEGIPVIVKSPAFTFHIPPWLDEAVLIGVSGSVSIASATDIEVNVSHAQPACDAASGVLDTKLLIEGGECYSDNAVVMDDVIVAAGDQLVVDVDQADGDGEGLDVAFVFTTLELLSFIVRGAQGAPGGIVNWTGPYDSGDTYSENDAVTNGGSSYVATVDNPTTEPGVDPGWEAEWMLLAGGEELRTTELEMAVTGNGYPIDPGHKDRIRVPFACTIVEASILADRAGDLVVDIWKSDYAGYPPDDTDSITGGNEPTLTAAIKTTDTALTGWTTAIAAGEILTFEVDSCETITQFTMSLIVERV